MAYDRIGTGMWTWIKSVGSVEDPLEPQWLENRGYLLSNVWFPKHPRSLSAGDLLVYYAATRGVFPAVVEILTGEVESDPNRSRYSSRWPWRMEVRPRLVIPSLDDAPTLEQVGIDSLRLRRQSHILLNAAEWERIRTVYLPPAGDET
jgi:hypothetical protein